MRVFLIGAGGQVARSLREAAAADPSISYGFGARPQLDLQDASSIEDSLAAFRPDIVVNPAAYTAVDKAESESDQAFAINRDGAREVARAAARLSVPVIHLSTDYVFDGTKHGAYTEQDPVAPLGVYGRSKLAGELAVADANPKHIILRTAWVYAPFGANFVRTILRLAGERDRLRIVADQRGCPTYAPDIATAILAIAKTWAGSGWSDNFVGVTNLCGPDVTTWCGFATEIVSGFAQRGGRSVPVDPITTADYPTPAARPLNSQLDTTRLTALFGIRVPSMNHSLSVCLDRLLKQ